MKLTNEQIQKHIATLPDNIRKAVLTFDWAKETMNIARTHNIQIDDIDAFRQETLMVILGLSPAEDFQKNIMVAMNIDRPTAQILVDEANEHIFGELQRRAFSSDDEDEESPSDDEEYMSSDPYHEPISHNDLKDVMGDEGIHLIDHDDYQPSTPIKDTHSEDDSNKVLEKTKSTPAANNSYLEPIEEKDMRGANKPQIDTSILKKQHQSSPENILSDTVTPKTSQSNSMDQNLDRKIMKEPFITQKDTVDLSPNENEIITEDGSFLEHLSQQDETL